MLPDRINNYLRDYGRITPDQPLVIGVSGGADSLALLYILVEIGCQLTVAHFNHHIRPEAEDDAIFVAEIADQLNLSLVRGDGDVIVMAETEKISIETAARKARYRFLFDTAEKTSAQAVVTAHNADDQVETVLLHLLRGAGLTGLRGMLPCTKLREFSDSIPLVRPLLATWRFEIDEYCQRKGLRPRVDSTNLDPSYTRNRIRRELVPLLETYNPQIKARLNGLATNVRSSIEILEPVVRKAYDACIVSIGEGVLDFDRRYLTATSHAMQVEIIRIAVQNLLPTAEDINQAALERAAALLTVKKGNRKTELADGLIAQVSDNFFRIAFAGSTSTIATWPKIADTMSADLAVPGCLKLMNGWEIQSKWIDGTAGISVTEGDQNTALMDASALTFPLSVRRWKQGDVFRPLGMKDGSLKLGDFFTNEKLPSEARDSWPLVISGERIAWVAGVRIADFVKVQKNSRRLVRLQLIKTR